MRLSSKPATKRARALRRAMTLPEVLLWRELRQRPSDLKFRRQHPSGPFVLDFYGEAAVLAIEVDGMAHDMGNAPQRDERRDAWLAERGITTLRIPAVDILRDLEAVVRHVVDRCHPLHHPAMPDGPPPLQGGISE